MEQVTSLSNNDIIKVVLGTGLLSGLVSALVAWAREYLAEKKKNWRSAQFSALRLSASLESFSIECAEMLLDNNAFYDSNGHDGNPISQIPKLSSFPEDIVWIALDTDLCEKVLAIPNKIRLSNGYISSVMDYEDAYEALAASSRNIGLCGYHAWEIASELRNRYKLPAFEAQTSWDFKNDLKRYSDKAMSELEQ